MLLWWLLPFFWYPFCKVDIWEISKLNTKNNPTKVKKSVTFWHSRWKIHLLNPLTFAQCLKIPRKVSFYNLTKGYANFGHFGREIQIFGKIWDIFSGFPTTVTLCFSSSIFRASETLLEFRWFCISFNRFITSPTDSTNRINEVLDFQFL